MRALFFLILVCISLSGCNTNRDPLVVHNEPVRMSASINTVHKSVNNFIMDPLPQYVVTNNWMLKPIINTRKKVVLLTIDDAPDKHALEMAKTLKQLHANAIFFVNGHFLVKDEQKQVLRKIHDMGFVIGNHTYNHNNLTTLSTGEQYNEIVPLNQMIEEIIGEKPTFFRAPYGENTEYSKKIAAKEGMVLMNWSYGYDWDPKFTTKEALTQIMVNSPYLQNGAILLMHDRDWTNQALKGIVEGIRSKGYETADPLLIKQD